MFVDLDIWRTLSLQLEMYELMVVLTDLVDCIGMS